MSLSKAHLFLNPIRLEDYKGAHEEICYSCRFCGYEFLRSPIAMSKITHCHGCLVGLKKKPFSAAKAAAFKELCLKKGIELLTYRGTGHKATLLCQRCDARWETVPWVIKSGGSCPNCVVCKSYSYKKYQHLDSVFKVQGYEDLFLDMLFKKTDVSPAEVTYGKGKVASFDYFYAGKRHKYYPDFQIRNKIVEVKSTWTAGLLEGSDREFYKLQAKAKAVELAGFVFKLFIIKKNAYKGGSVEVARLPEAWHRLSLESFKSALKWKDYSAFIDRSLLLLSK